MKDSTNFEYLTHILMGVVKTILLVPFIPFYCVWVVGKDFSYYYREQHTKYDLNEDKDKWWKATWEE